MTGGIAMVTNLKPNPAVTGRNIPTPPVEVLTPRQLEVLALLCEGLPNKLISRRLNIANGTVKVHVVQILRALGVASRLQAVVAARNLGLVDASYNLLPMQATASALERAGAQRQPAGGGEGASWRVEADNRSLATA
jgi:DNA-binding CsgD family transcriptional regulator